MKTLSAYAKKNKYYYVFLATLLFFFVFFFKTAFIRTIYQSIILISISAYYAYNARKCPIRLQEVVLFFCVLVYGWILGDADFAFNSVCLIVLTQVASRSVTNYFVKNGEESYIYLIGSFILGYTLFSLLDMTGCFGLDWKRDWPGFWTGVMEFATYHSIFYCPILALLFPLLLFFRKHKVICGLGLLAFTADLAFSVYSESRLQIMVMGITFGIELIVYLILNRKKQSEQKKNILMGIAIVALVGVVFLILVCFNAFGVKDSEYYAKVIKVLTRDGGFFNNVRFRAQRVALKQLFLYPMGGYKMDTMGLAHFHNVWFDMLNGAGIIPFTLFIIYTVISLINLIKMFIFSNISEEVKYLLLSCFLSVFLVYGVESCYLMSIYFIVPWAFINGIIGAIDSGISIRKKN